MGALSWFFGTADSFSVAGLLLYGLGVSFLIYQSDFAPLLVAWFWRHTFWRQPDRFEARRAGRPSGLVIIPSLLRGHDDLNAIQITVESCGTNGYPSELVIIASVDGRTDKPALFTELKEWVGRQSYPANVHVYVTGTETRLGKVMAIEAGVRLMKQLVAEGAHAAYPQLYFSCDGDGTLGENALERLADRLTTPHPLTGNLRRVVASKVCLRPELFWQGWTAKSFCDFFTVKGQIYRQVAREFLAMNIYRFNWKITPKIGIPGGLYCTWSELFNMAPHYMAFMKTLRFRQWVRWWLGLGPPRFSQCSAPPLFEAIAGATDDTCIAFLACIASWRNGKLSLDAPATPLHALGRLFVQCLFERSHDYAPEARLFTYSPSTLHGIWTQRVRWNSARLECAGRFWRAFGFHWELGLPTCYDVTWVVLGVFAFIGYYAILPYYLICTEHGLTVYVLCYSAQLASFTLRTVFALFMEREWRKFWPVILCRLPLSPLYHVCINTYALRIRRHPRYVLLWQLDQVCAGVDPPKGRNRAHRNPVPPSSLPRALRACRRRRRRTLRRVLAGLERDALDSERLRRLDHQRQAAFHRPADRDLVQTVKRRGGVALLLLTSFGAPSLVTVGLGTTVRHERARGCACPRLPAARRRRARGGRWDARLRRRDDLRLSRAEPGIMPPLASGRAAAPDRSQAPRARQLQRRLCHVA